MKAILQKSLQLSVYICLWLYAPHLFAASGITGVVRAGGSGGNYGDQSAIYTDKRCPTGYAPKFTVGLYDTEFFRGVGLNRIQLNIIPTTNPYRQWIQTAYGSPARIGNDRGIRVTWTVYCE